jgi:hypothetical protein
MNVPAAFIPAESPPEVSTAIFFCLFPEGLGMDLNVSSIPSRSLATGTSCGDSGEDIVS